MMELGAETSLLEKTEDLSVSVLDGFLLAIGYGFSMNGVAVIVIKDKNVVVAVNGRYDKSTFLVGTVMV